MSYELTDEEFEKQLAAIDNEPIEEDNNIEEDENGLQNEEENAEEENNEENEITVENEEELSQDENEEDDLNNTEEDNDGTNINDDSVTDNNNDDDNTNNNDIGSNEVVNEDTGLTNSEEAQADKLDIDYEEYKQLKDFYNKVTGEFKANGKVVKGFTDPDKLIQAQQMAYGYSKKMQKFNEYKPYLKALQENELLDENRLNLLIEASKGKPEAIKQLIETAKLDPRELDFEEIDSSNYQPENHLPNKYENELDNLLDISKDLGIDDKVQQELNTNWDTESLTELLDKPEVKEDFIKHIEVGVYDAVLDKIERKKALDRFGLYSKKKFIDQYREAATELEQELMQQLQAQQQAQQQEVEMQQQQNMPSEAEIQAEIERLKAEEEYKKKIAQKTQQIESNKRKVATKVKKRKPKRNNIDFDPLSMSDEEVEKFLNML